MTIEQERDIAVKALERIRDMSLCVYSRNIASKNLEEIVAQESLAQDARSQFEVWARDAGNYSCDDLRLTRHGSANHVEGITYDNQDVQQDWNVWQACCVSIEVPAAHPVGVAAAYVSASEFAKLADNRVAGIGMMLSKEPADDRIALYTDPASTKLPSTGLQIAIAAHDLLRAAEACGQVLTIHLEPRLPLAMGNYVMTYEVRPVLVRP